MTGAIQELRDGYGFIRGDDGLRYYFARSALDRMSGLTFKDLGNGLEVSFTGIDHPRGPRALEVRATARSQHGSR